MTTPMRCARIEQSIDAVVERVGKHIVLAMPLGIGKPNAWVNALYRRVKADPAMTLKIFTALSLDRPKGKSLIERRFLDPFVARVFEDYPDMDYSVDVKRRQLPRNVEVCEFFLKTGEYIGNATAQQHYIYSNYTHVVRDMMLNGVNVLAQALAVETGEDGVERFSLSSNSDLTMEALEMWEAARQNTLFVGVINRRMPFMPNDAVLDPAWIDIVVDDPQATHAPFAPPNMKVDDQDYAIALWASTLVKDGGTLQIGIGSLGDGIAQALIERDRDNAGYREMIDALSCGQPPAGAQLEPFREGLFGCSEMFVAGFMALIEAGVIRREVFDHIGLQKLLNTGHISTVPNEAMLGALCEAGLIGSPLSRPDVDFLRHFGILRRAVRLQDGDLTLGELRLPATPADPAVRARIAAEMLGPRLTHGRLMHGGFFIGPHTFYEKLRAMPRELLEKINMTRIAFINQVFGQESLAQVQRRDARFINTTMMVTLLGAAVSDALDTGDFISGVGGQYNFVAQGHTLPDARSILMLRAWRTNKRGKPVSNIVWNYGHVTIPRHLRDVYITEYGIADLRGRSDAEVVKRLLAVADSRFQEDLLAKAKAHGKVEPEYEIPAAQRNNLPEVVEARLARFRESGKLPNFPFGTDFDQVELKAAKALVRLKEQKASKLALLGALARSLTARPPQDVMARLGLDAPKTLEERLMRALVAGNL